MVLRRGEIWYVDFFRGSIGLELGNKVLPDGYIDSKRPAIVVSGDSFNAGSKRATVVPLMNYHDLREYEIDYGFKVTPSPYDIVPPSSKSNYNHFHKTSIVDCGQLWTIDELDAICICGRLKSQIRLDINLQVVVGGGISGDREDLPFAYGDVILVSNPDGRTQEALVVSHELIDIRRHRAYFRPFSRYYNQLTIVPLIPSGSSDIDYAGVAIVEKFNRSSSSKEFLIANCQVIFSIDWEVRRPTLVGIVKDMASVNAALREYLDIPPLGGFGDD